MAVMSVHAEQDLGLLTIDDLDALPEDGLRHELIDGAFIMTPSPVVAHQLMVGAVYRLLHSAAHGSDLVALLGPADLVVSNPLSGFDQLVPDLLVARSDQLGPRKVTIPPLLVVEVRSPSTAAMDRGRKREIYQRVGIPSYWLLDPQEPSATILELQDGQYEQVAQASGDTWIGVSLPVALRLNPAELAAG